MNDDDIRITYIQFGDFKRALDQYAANELESYHAQKYSVDYVLNQSKKYQNVSVICVQADKEYRDRSQESIHLYGLDYYGGSDQALIFEYLSEAKPSHLVLRAPMARILKWSLSQTNMRILPLFADSFSAKSSVLGYFKAYVRNHKLKRLLNSKRIDIVANHNIAACQDLCRIGVNREKIIPWDWPRTTRPEQFSPKRLKRNGKLKLLYVGSISEEKGVGDIMEAIASSPELREKSTLTLAGTGDIEEFRNLCSRKGISGVVHFLGRIPLESVVKKMRASDVVLVPTWHSYSEGMPGVVYQSMAVRTPIIATNHPMFVHYLKNGDGLIYINERSPHELSDSILKLVSSEEIYYQISVASMQAFHKLVHKTLWHEVIDNWLDDTPAAREWLKTRINDWSGLRV